MFLIILWAFNFVNTDAPTGKVYTSKRCIEGTIQINLESNFVIVKELDAKSGDTRYHQIMAAEIDEVVLVEHDDLIKYVGVQISNLESFFLMQLLFKGESNSLLKRSNLKLSQYDDRIMPEYYIILNNNVNATPIFDKKSLLDLLSDELKVIKYYIKIHNIDLSKESDLVSLIAYYNELY